MGEITREIRTLGPYFDVNFLSPRCPACDQRLGLKITRSRKWNNPYWWMQ
jgi:hypothetical protein